MITMFMVHNILTHRSADNRVLEKSLMDRVETMIQEKRLAKRYKRIWFYFFEQEIRSDIKQTLIQHIQLGSQHLIDPEYQALIARSALKKTHTYSSRDTLFIVTNNYIFSQWEFANLDYVASDEQLIKIIIDAIRQKQIVTLTDESPLMSDVLFELRRVRADVHIVEEITEWKHTYQTLLQWCRDYVGTFAQLPRFVSLISTGWSMETLMQVIDQPNLLKELLVPNYSISYALLDADDIVPYGTVDVQKTPYATWFSRIGYWWTTSAWYRKVWISLFVIVVSGFLWWPTLFILPIVWWLLAFARTQSQYLMIFQQLLSRWYLSYQDQHNEYSRLYNTMIDPDENTDQTLDAQRLMLRWYDVIPFAGHELMRDATIFAKNIYHHLMHFNWTDSHVLRDIATVDALTNWTKNNHFPLFVIQDNQYSEQTLYRLYSLLHEIKNKVLWHDGYQLQYDEQYESVDELIATKKYGYRLWTIRNALWDGVKIGVSSGVLWWMGSYLWNWHTVSVVAMSPSLILDPLTTSDELLQHVDLIDQMGKVMSQQDIDRFFDVIVTQPSTTLWDTMVDTFWYKQGNIYTNHLMDIWWRISDNGMTSELFESSFHGGIPTITTDEWWGDLMDFLHRTYDYDNLSEYSSLLDKPWLSQTLQNLKTGEMTIKEFALLSIEQREIITQALFYHLNPEILKNLFDGGVNWEELIDPGTIVWTWDNIDVIGTWETVNTVQNWDSIDMMLWILEQGRKLLDRLFHNTPVIQTWENISSLSGVDVETGIVDDILSWLHAEQLQWSGADVDIISHIPIQNHIFTIPVSAKHKKFE